MAGKYAALEKYLREIPDHQQEITLGFQGIETILHDRLPASAYEDERWWMHEKEGNHVSPRAWTSAGWKIGSVDVPGNKVTLVRSEPPHGR